VLKILYFRRCPLSKIESPQHYNLSIDGVTTSAKSVIRAVTKDYFLGNVLKYVIRAGKKPNEPAIDDLKKAREYLTFAIEEMEDE
jgi:Protein of unknwon function (DUF3310)